MASWHATEPITRQRLVGDAFVTSKPAHRAGRFLLSQSCARFAAWLHQEDPEDAASRFRVGPKEKEESAIMSKARHGSALESFLDDEGILEDATLAAVKKVIAWQLAGEMDKKGISKVRMAEMMKTSRAQLDRVLDPASGNITLETLHRAAALVGRKLKLELV
jgi:antitoxin HicB